MILFVFFLIVLISSGASVIWNILLLRNYGHKKIVEGRVALWFYLILGVFGVFLSIVMMAVLGAS